MPPAPCCGLAVIHPSAERRPAAPSHPSLLPSPTPRLCLGPTCKFCTFFTSQKAPRLSRSQHTERSPCAPLWAGQGTRVVSHRPKGLFSGGLGGASEVREPQKRSAKWHSPVAFWGTLGVSRSQSGLAQGAQGQRWMPVPAPPHWAAWSTRLRHPLAWEQRGHRPSSPPLHAPGTWAACVQ